MNAQPRLFKLSIQTPDGEFTAGYSDKGLAYLSFPGNSKARLTKPEAIPIHVLRWHELTSKALRVALVGVVPGRLPPLDLSAGTSFQQAVWNALLAISPGQTRSYGEIARAIGKPRAVRAAGGACGANPIPIFVPCHRVLAANKKLGGFSGGPGWKETLLAREGVSLF